MRDLNLYSLINKLLKSAPKKQVQLNKSPPHKKEGFTVRLEDDVRSALESHATTLGVSLQDFIRITLKSLVHSTYEEKQSELEIMVDRFHHIFKAHDIAQADIPVLLDGSDITNSTLLDDKLLIDKLTPELLVRLSNYFDIRLDWLKGKDSDAYETYLADKYMGYFGGQLLRKVLQNFDCTVHFIVQKGFDFKVINTESYRPYMGIVVESKKRINNVTFTTHEIWRTQPWGYSRSREHLKSIMLLCDKASKVHEYGITVDDDAYKHIFDRSHDAELITQKNMSNFIDRWYPDQYFWDDDRNPQLNEVEHVLSTYKQYDLGRFKKAISDPYLVVNPEKYIAGSHQLKLKDD